MLSNSNKRITGAYKIGGKICDCHNQYTFRMYLCPTEICEGVGQQSLNAHLVRPNLSEDVSRLNMFPCRITRIPLLPFRLSQQLLYYRYVIQNGLLSSLPHVVSYIGAVMSGELADFLRRHKIFSTTVTRKLFQCICMFPDLRQRISFC